VILEKLKFKTREEILKIDSNFLSEHKLNTVTKKIDKKIYRVLQICFPELNIQPWETKVTSNGYFNNQENIEKAIDWFLEINNIPLSDIHNISFNFEDELAKKGLSCLTQVYFKGSVELFEWYCKKKGFEFSIHKRKYKPNGYWNSKENFEIQFKMYIESLLENNLIDNYQVDLPAYLKKSFIDTTEFKMLVVANNKQNYYKSLIDCANTLYPHFNLDIENIIPIGCDGVTILNSYQEKKVFDYIYDKMKIRNIKAIGISKGNNFYNDEFKEKYYPDFEILSLLDKPIIIEYYGLYDLRKSPNEMVYKYMKKTDRKNDFYRQNNNIYFVDLYPSDLANNCEGIKNKINKYTNSKGGENR
jgi:hypothetical protein